jgi:hypothetical protein
MIIIAVLLMLCFKQLAGAAPLQQICGTNGTYKPKSIYQANLQLLSTTLMNASSSSEATTPPVLFAKGSVGAAPDIVYGLALCRGDTANGSACAACVATAFRDARRLCALNTEAHVLYEACMLHFSYEDFVYRDDQIERGFLVVEDPSNDTIVANDVVVLLRDTANQAAYNSTSRYATGRMDVGRPGVPALYSLMQCTPNLSPDQCSDCFKVYGGLVEPTAGEHGVWIAGVWCSYRYSTYQFYQGQPVRRIGSSPPTTNTTTAPAPAPARVVVMPGEKPKSKNKMPHYFFPREG